MKKVSILHYMPLEYYPPVTNFLNYLSGSKLFKLSVYSTYNSKNRKEYDSKRGTTIFRAKLPHKDDTVLVRLANFFKYNINFTYKIFREKPDVLIYYESISVLPALFYLIFKSRNKVKLVIIHHEYFSKEWYRTTAPIVVKFNHFLEKLYLYDRADSISQTNLDRSSRFAQDNNIDLNKLFEMPNYPPSCWSDNDASFSQTETNTIKFVYVGSLALAYSHLEKFCEWVISNKYDVLFDIYSFNIERSTKEYLESLGSDRIHLFTEGIDYEDLPKMLREYDVGLILYNAVTDNYKYNAPNKLFEYLACGLDIWFSKDLITSRNYVTEGFYPQVIQIDFENLIKESLETLKRKPNFKYQKSKFYCENIYKSVVEQRIMG